MAEFTGQPPYKKSTTDHFSTDSFSKKYSARLVFEGPFRNKVGNLIILDAGRKKDLTVNAACQLLTCESKRSEVKFRCYQAKQSTLLEADRQPAFTVHGSEKQTFGVMVERGLKYTETCEIKL